MPTPPSPDKKVRVKLAVVIGVAAAVALGVLLLLIGRSCVGSRDGGPGAGAQAGKEPLGDVTTPYVLVVTVRASDALPPAAMIIEVGASEADAICVIPEGNGMLEVGPGFAAALTREAGEDSRFHVQEGVRSLEDVRWVALVEREYVGARRGGRFRDVYVGKAPVEPPTYALPESLTIEPFDSVSDLLNHLPWPEGLAWSAAGDTLTLRAGGEAWTLSAGQEQALPAEKRKVSVRMGDLPVSAVGDDDGPVLPDIEWEELEDVSFTTEITVRYHGRLKVGVIGETAPPGASEQKPPEKKEEAE